MASKKRGMSSPLDANAETMSSHTRTRVRNGISLEQVVEKTKISLRYLHAIEAEDFNQLPGGIFALNYLRQYAEAAGVDPDDLINLYTGKLSPQRIGPSSEPRSFLDRLFRVPA
jgi:cytoskeletal protein RodZ